MSNEPAVRILELDLEYLHRTIDKFDNQRFTIRNWAATTTGALLAVSVATRNAGVPIIGLFVVLLFACLEVVYMEIQVRVQDRCTKVGHLLHALALDPSKGLGEDYIFGIRAALGHRNITLTSMRNAVAPRPELYLVYVSLMVILGVWIGIISLVLR